VDGEADREDIEAERRLLDSPTGAVDDDIAVGPKAECCPLKDMAMVECIQWI
jgi:hypothetical protein